MIDAHVHCFPGNLAPRALSKTNMYGTYETDGTIEGQLRLAKRYAIEKIMVLNIANKPEQQEHVNQYAISINGLEDKVVSLGSDHPFAPNAVETVEWLYEQGIRGIKFQPIRQKFYMDDPICRPIFRKIGELGMLTVIHGGRSIRTEHFHVLPKAIGRCIDEFQGAPVICSHMAGMFCAEDEIKKLAAMPVYTDTALCARHLDQKKFAWAAEQFGADRILFGTDMPWANMEKEMSYIQKSFFGAGDQEKIFRGNALALFERCGMIPHLSISNCLD